MMLLNNEWVNSETKGKIKRHLEKNGNENKTTPNLWDTEKAVVRGKFIVLQAYLEKQEKPTINNLTLHLKELEKNTTRSPK